MQGHGFKKIETDQAFHVITGDVNFKFSICSLLFISTSSGVEALIISALDFQNRLCTGSFTPLRGPSSVSSLPYNTQLLKGQICSFQSTSLKCVHVFSLHLKDKNFFKQLSNRFLNHSCQVIRVLPVSLLLMPFHFQRCPGLDIKLYYHLSPKNLTLSASHL